MERIRSVSPFRCKMWDLHDRLEAEISEQSCSQELESFARHGQLVPVLARPCVGDPSYDLELIYGARRLYWARHTNRQLLAEVRELSDIEAIIAMDIENRHRKDVSPYERGLSYARWLKSGHFDSQDELAKTLRISSSQVSRLLKLARLPSVVVSAFPLASEICEGWGTDLVEQLEDPQRGPAIIARARAISARASRPSAQVVYSELIKAKGVRGAQRRRRDEVVMDGKGAPLFRIRWQRKAVALVVPLEKMRDEVLQQIREQVLQVLSTHSAPGPALQTSMAEGG